MQSTKSPSAKPLRNAFVTLILGVVVFWLGYESNERGVFKMKRPSTEAVASAPPVASESATTPSVAEASPTPLPPHFPTVEENDLAAKKAHDEMSLSAAFSSCWVGAQEVPQPENAMMTLNDITTLFGKLKKREVLEKTEHGTKLGLILEPEIFLSGAAGTATELDGKITEFKLRADGRILQCQGAERCLCL